MVDVSNDELFVEDDAEEPADQKPEPWATALMADDRAVVIRHSPMPHWDRERQAWYVIEQGETLRTYIAHDEADERFQALRTPLAMAQGAAFVVGAGGAGHGGQASHVAVGGRVMPTEEALLRRVLDALTARITKQVAASGFNDDRSFGDAIALLHSEVSEALEEYRNHGFDEYSVPSGTVDHRVVEKPCGVAIEFADVFIRLLDDCARFGVDLVSAVERKMAYNATRPWRHGNRRL